MSSGERKTGIRSWMSASLPVDPRVITGVDSSHLSGESSAASGLRHHSYNPANTVSSSGRWMKCGCLTPSIVFHS